MHLQVSSQFVPVCGQLQFNVQRLPFDEDHAVETLDQAIWALQKVLDDVAKVSQKL